MSSRRFGRLLSCVLVLSVVSCTVHVRDPFRTADWGQQMSHKVGERFTWGLMSLMNEGDRPVTFTSITPHVQGFKVLDVHLVGYPRPFAGKDISVWPPDPGVFGHSISDVKGFVLPPAKEIDNWSTDVLIGLEVVDPHAELRGVDVTFTIDGHSGHHFERASIGNCSDVARDLDCPAVILPP